MSRTILYLAALCVILVVLPACQETPTAVVEVGEALDSLDQRLEWLDYRLEQERWNQARRGETDSLKFYEDLLQAVMAGPHAIALVGPGQASFDDPTDERRYRRLRSRVVRTQVERDPGISALRDSLVQSQAEFAGILEGRRQNRESLRWVVANDPDRNRRELAYSILAGAGEDLADGVQRLIRLRNQLAQKRGYNNYLALVFDSRNIEPGDYVTLLSRIKTESSDKYSEVLSSIEHQLGRNMIEIWDLEYAASDVRHRVDGFFPTDSQLAFVHKSLLAIGYDIKNMPLYFDLREFSDQPAEVVSFNFAHGHDHRILGNLTPGLASTRRLMLHTGRMLYGASISQPGEDDAMHPDGVWEKGMAGIVAAFCDAPEWLETQAHLPNELATAYASSVKQQRLIALRRSLANMMFEYEAYQDANRDLNELYWSVYGENVGMPLHEQSRPWADLNALIDQPLTLSDELTADMIVAQTIAFLERNYQSLLDPTMTRAFLEQNYFRFGGRRDWHELIDRGTDEPLNHKHLLAWLGI